MSSNSKTKTGIAQVASPQAVRVILILLAIAFGGCEDFAWLVPNACPPGIAAAATFDSAGIQWGKEGVPLSAPFPHV